MCPGDRKKEGGGEGEGREGRGVSVICCSVVWCKGILVDE